MYTLEPNKLAPLSPRHSVLAKIGQRFSAEDVDQQPLDLVLLDCHDFRASLTVMEVLLTRRLLSAEAMIVLLSSRECRSLGWT